MKKAIDVAKVLLTLSDPDSGDALTNLKLQKLLYYVQGFHLAIKGEPLFAENIIHWEHGPVVKEVYKEFCPGSEPIDVPTDFSPEMFSEEELGLIAEVNRVYGQFSAWKLRDMTHRESPWLSTSTNEVISIDLMKTHFLTLVG